MTKEAALQAFFSQFLPSYAATAVPPGTEFPYLTYTPVADVWEGGDVSISVDLWYYTTSEATPNAKEREISTVFSEGPVTLPCDGGYIWLKRGSPWCQSLTAEGDDRAKQRRINISAEYFTLI